MATHQPQTERVTYLTNAEQKAALEAFARARGESVGSVLREAAARYISEPDPEPTAAEEAALKLLVEELKVAVPKMHASLDRSIKRMQETNDKIDRTLAEMDARR